MLGLEFGKSCVGRGRFGVELRNGKRLIGSCGRTGVPTGVRGRPSVGVLIGDWAVRRGSCEAGTEAGIVWVQGQWTGE